MEMVMEKQKEKKNSKYWKIFFYHDNHNVTFKVGYDVMVDLNEISFINVLNENTEKIEKNKYIRREALTLQQVHEYLEKFGIYRRLE